MKVNGNRYLVDTNILVDFFKGDQRIHSNLSRDDVFIPSVAIGELYFGAYASKITKNREGRLRDISYLTSQYSILEVSKSTSEYYGKIKSDLKSIGKPIPENDIWIAALAKEHELTLVTKDQHFNHIGGLETVAW